MSQPSELKHLSSWRKERLIDSLSSGERREEPKPCDLLHGVVGQLESGS